ncbi:hypothetical protein [Pseudomonas sp. W5-01]|uniref:hypothetical protein n=1 Tax=Pseudomonas sp. W5-01 TaxID=3097454 RepID=UPI00397DE804
MGSKRKPFITSKAISEAVIRSGERNNWSVSEVTEVWKLAAYYLTEELIDTAFHKVIHEESSAALFRRCHYKVKGSEILHLDQPASASNPVCILGKKVRTLIKEGWPLEPSTANGPQWHDFTDAILMMLMKRKVLSNHLKGKKIEQDLGL